MIVYNHRLLFPLNLWFLFPWLIQASKPSSLSWFWSPLCFIFMCEGQERGHVRGTAAEGEGVVSETDLQQ